MAKLTRKKVIEIVEKLKTFKGIETDTEFAEFLGISNSTISAWKRRGNVDFIFIKSKLPDISIDWLLSGDSSEHGIITDDDITLAESILNTQKIADENGFKLIYKLVVKVEA